MSTSLPPPMNSLGGKLALEVISGCVLVLSCVLYLLQAAIRLCTRQILVFKLDRIKIKMLVVYHYVRP